MTAIESSFMTDLAAHFSGELLRAGYVMPQKRRRKGEPAGPAHDAQGACSMYLNVLSRSIQPKPRPCIRSKVLQTKVLLGVHESGIRQIEAASLAGQPLTRFQSRRYRRAGYHDRFLNDWGIKHLHIAPRGMPEDAWLLFVLDRDDALYFVDVGPHDFSDVGLLETIHGEWPHLLANARAPMVVPGSATRFTPDAHRRLRGVNVNRMTTMADGTSYTPPGGGIVGSGLSIKVALQTDHIMRTVRKLEQECQRGGETIANIVAASTGRRPETLSLLMRVDLPWFRAIEETAGVEVARIRL